MPRAHVPKVGRFAPSPTGALHVGSLIAALASFCDARAVGGRWLLRVDDIDPPREVPGAAARFEPVLAAMGFVPDPPVLRQSDRSSRYRAALHALNDAGRLYRCDCTRRMLVDEPRYTGRCRTRAGGADRGAIAGLIDSGRATPVALRVRLDAVSIHDRLFGELDNADEPGVPDVVVRRKDGLISYHLACAIDDSPDEPSGVTDVVRGADLLESSLPQHAIRAALGLASPRLLHVPVAIHPSGDKLSKRTLAPGVEGEAVLPLLAACWRFLGQRPVESVDSYAFLAAAVAAWDVARLPRVRERLWNVAC